MNTSYQPPEYLQKGHMSPKTDAYAFGVVLMGESKLHKFNCSRCVVRFACVLLCSRGESDLLLSELLTGIRPYYDLTDKLHDAVAKYNKNNTNEQPLLGATSRNKLYTVLFCLQWEWI